MKTLKIKNSTKAEFFSKQNEEIEKYAQIGKTAHELFHDLLNPIAGFMLQMDLMNKNELSPEEIDMQSEQINESIDRIRKFIKLVQGSIGNKEKIEELDLDENIRDIMSLLYYKARRNKVSIVLITNGSIKIKIQKIKLYQLIINLLSNALDSYEEINDNRKRQVTITTKKGRKNITMTFRDNGCGISRSKIKNIFEVNYSDKQDGFGLGLKTVKKIVEEDFCGNINVRSVLGKGTKFILKIPKNHL